MSGFKSHNARQIKTQTAWHRAEDVTSHELRERDVEGDILELST